MADAINDTTESKDGYYNVADIYPPTSPGAGGTLLTISFFLKKPGESIRRDLVKVILRDYAGGDILQYENPLEPAINSKSNKKSTPIDRSGEISEMQKEVEAGKHIAGIILIILTHSNDNEYGNILEDELELLDNFFLTTITKV